MHIVHRNCGGLDVHKETVVACIMWVLNGVDYKAIRTFGTTTRDLLALLDWLLSKGITHVAMEATGVFWKPVFNILEGHVGVLLANPAHIKQVPGRKSDVSDCEWICDLDQHGLIRASFIPDRPQRDLRDLTRHRAQLVGEKGRIANRIMKVLEDANIKLASVASDVLGVSGRAMIQSLIAGKLSPEQMAELSRGKMRVKRPQLTAALEGFVREHHQFMLQQLWNHLSFIEKAIASMESRIEEQIRPFSAARSLLMTIPGVKEQVAAALLAEIGSDMSVFPSAGHLASWAALCPGNNSSAGKRRSGKTRHGNHWLRRCLSQAAWAAAHTKNTYLSSQYHRLAGRRGKKRAIIAVAHSILIIAHEMLKNGECYRELGAEYLDRAQGERLKRSLVRRLSNLGYQVTLTPTLAPVPA